NKNATAATNNAPTAAPAPIPAFALVDKPPPLSAPVAVVSIGPVGVGVDGVDGTVLAGLETAVVDDIGIGIGVGEDDVSGFNATVEDNANIDAG
ncbi:hypothetical protein J4E93_010547, partial [Alternaria ventricosa]|uniref:uncharacterized protein n=1 Tax=Alternaria ventricosa TaxID=1187951 RepID=UPI0020C5057F